MKTSDTTVGLLESFDGNDLFDLCEATDAAILDGGGFGFVSPPDRNWLEGYWRGVLLVPERALFAARRENRLCGSVQLLTPPPNNEAQRSIATVQHLFVAPWARGFGIGQMLMQAVESHARAKRFKVLNLDVRQTQAEAIRMYETLGYERWGVHPKYAHIRGRWVRGVHFFKDIGQKRPKTKQ